MKGHYHMNSLTQSNQNLNLQLQSTLDFSLSLLKAPFVSQMSYLDYGYLFNNLDQWIRSFTLRCLANTIEKADIEFRNAPGRTRHYYVKQTRQRTIITILGPLTFNRTEYIDRFTNDSFIPIDRKLCLLSRQRYDCCVEAKAKELYADHNSMIKVGKILGEMIYGHFSLNPDKKLFNVPRQTIWNLLHRITRISTLPTAVDDTPDTLYIMADEKYVPLQGEHSENETEEEKKKHIKEMVKVGVCFEGKMRESRKDGTLTDRYHLVNKFAHACCTSENKPFWPIFMDKLAHRYDLTKVKRIYILGDGATWIKSGVNELTMTGTSVKYALDKFHASQAINKMTQDETYKDLLTYYLYNDQLDDFRVLSKIIKEEKSNDSSKETFEKYYDYLIKNWKSFQVMVKEVTIGCAMEQAISHIIASPFTSVPKAYGRNNLPIYLDSRIHLQNNEDLLMMHLKALQLQKNKGDEVSLSDSLDLSFFDDQIPNETYTLHVRNRSHKKQEFRF